MHPIVKEVKTAGKVVSTLSVDCFDTLEELCASVSDAQVVSYYNTQKVENERNLERAKFQPDKASKEKKLKAAWVVAFQMFNAELDNAVKLGQDAVDALLSRTDVQAEVEKRLSTSAVM